MTVMNGILTVIADAVPFVLGGAGLACFGSLGWQEIKEMRDKRQNH